MPSSKNKKNAKNSGGIAAAVTKQTASKLSQDNGTASGNDSSKSPEVSDASSLPSGTPEFKPSAPYAPYNGNHAPSPLLEALSTTSVSASTAPSMTNEWSRGGMAGSPGNLINLMSDSPPTQPSSYEGSDRLHQPWAAQRPFMSPSPSSLSPPNATRRPLSFQSDAALRPVFGTPPQVSTAPHRRSSLYSQFPRGRAGSNPPPLPHQPQPHFYGAQDLDMTLGQQHEGMKAGDHGFFFGFDRLPSTPEFPNGSDNVVLAGYEGGLEVYTVSKRGLDRIAGLKGLRGGVLHAKILPWTVNGPADSVFPLVAVVVHGPVLPSRPQDAAGPDLGSQSRPDSAASPAPSKAPHDTYQGRAGPGLNSYQTAVEVYSLKTSKLIDVLLQAPKIPISTAISLTNPLFQPPPASGAFTIKADGRTIAVCSGVTGECWVYEQLLEYQNNHMFACSGKLWTCLQQKYRGDVAEEGDKMHSPAPPPRPNSHTPIFALNGRWIAYCPSTPSSQISIGAHLPVPILGRAPGVSSKTPPHLPSATAAVDLPISDSVVNKIMRETTQELIHGAKWVGQQGWQAWNAYWNRPSGTSSQQQQARSPPQQWAGTRSPHADPSQFPPTHGSSGQATPKDPGFVSLIDIESLPASSSIHPLTTFATPLGCSFLSFAPSSLALFSASTRGDVQTVWDLLRIHHTQSSPLQATLSSNEGVGPQVRQIAQFSRMTVARIIDVAWSEPLGERIAMVTERGTVHLLDMPFSAFLWPPPRRRKLVAKSATETSEPPSSAVAIASGAFGAAYQAAKPFVTRSRRSSGNVPAVVGPTLKDSAAQSGRVIAASITHSLGKTGSAINQLRHTAENRVSLPQGRSVPSAACVTWVKGRKSHTLFSVGGGLVRTFPCKPRQATVQAGKRIARASRYKDTKVPLLPDDVVALAVRQIMDLGVQEEYLELSDAEMEAGNTMTLQGRPRTTPAAPGTDLAIPQAEIESSAPYQPFHTDRRITLCEYSRDASGQLEPLSALLINTSLEDAVTPPKSNKKNKGPRPTEMLDGRSDPLVWAFGQDIPSVKLDLGVLPLPGEDSGGPDDFRALPTSAMERVMEYGSEEQIVVTTRRRRTAQQGDPDEDGFFEDDCEVLDFADQRV